MAHVTFYDRWDPQLLELTMPEKIFYKGGLYQPTEKLKIPYVKELYLGKQDLVYAFDCASLESLEKLEINLNSSNLDSLERELRTVPGPVNFLNLRMK